MDQGREAADCYHWRWCWGRLGTWWGKGYFPPNQFVKPAFHVTAKRAFARHVGGSHDLETSNQAQISPFLSLAVKALILGNKENKKPPLLLMRCLRLSASDSAQLKNDSGVHWVE